MLIEEIFLSPMIKKILKYGGCYTTGLQTTNYGTNYYVK